MFSVERLEQHAESLAAAQRVSVEGGRAIRRAPRLYADTKALITAYRAIVNATRAHQPITLAAEWLLDNFHVVDEQIREIKDDLPPGFYRVLPKLADGPLAGYPRVYGVAWALVAHTDSAFDVLKLTRLVAAYQRVQPLTIGELWAIAITLRITLVENLRRLAEAIVARLDASRRADALMDRILGTKTSSGETAATVMHSLDQIPWSTAFAVQLAQRLRDRDPEATPALQWLNKKLSAEGTTTDQIVRDEVQRQSAMNVTVRNVITSMRLISTINWAEWFESVSLVDEALRAASDFAAMDFTTRDLYRRAIEEMARNSGHDEIEIAQQAIAAAKQAADVATRTNAASGRECDPGYYLISKGRQGFERLLNGRVPLRRRLFHVIAAGGIYSYVGMIALVGAIVLGFGLAVPAYGGLDSWTIALLATLGVVPASDVAVALVNRLITQTVGATPLPGLELREGVPADLRTIVVVPTMLTNQESVGEQVERLEIHYLSNADDNLHFALLSDWVDSTAEVSATDEELLGAAAAGIARLNQQYGPAKAGSRFFLLHRRRVWNKGENKWIGWERKRGKLHELNRLLRGATDTTFLNIDGKSALLPAVRYVITLDADTRMPIGAAKRLIGKMAHPLNRPRFDQRLGRVVEGHGILQPRVTPSLPIRREGSLFQRAFSGPNGLDPYAFAVSDVYQDLFEEGSYVGKGIYDVDVVERAMQEKIPDSAILSHDLLEGIFARAGLASDIEFVEEFPSRYDVASARQHRWVRGDWQLLPWLFGRGSGRHDNSERSALPVAGRWKLLDNMRRSLSAPAALLALIVGWLQPFDAAVAWTAFLLFTLAFPPLLPAIANIVPKRATVSLRNHLNGVRKDLALGLLQSAFLFTFLAHQAWLMADAMMRTLYRLFIARRRLLEWTTAAQSGEDAQFDTRALGIQILASIAFAACVGLVIVFVGNHTWPLAGPFAALWVFSPVVARLASLPPPVTGHLTVTAADADVLRMIARRTWRFFEIFVTPEDNMLPPDNFQEDPHPVVAHRTSPTNMGLYLLSVVIARDFGWLGTFNTADRLEATFATMGRLERFRGHFYNWYDTQSLHPLEPKYISSVDSGNLAGHLIALGNACREIIAGPAFHPRWSDGLKDTIGLLAESLRAIPHESGPPKLATAIDEFGGLLARSPGDVVALARFMDELVRRAEAIAQAAKEFTDKETCDVRIWADALRTSVHAHRHDFETIMPWAGIVARDVALVAGDSALSRLAEISTLEHLPQLCDAARCSLKERKTGSLGNDPNAAALVVALEKSEEAARLLVHRLATLAETSKTMATAMEFGFLFDRDRQLLSIGYRGADASLDSNYYDLLASEARLASFIAIAKGDVPARHWFHLGRTLTPIDGGSGLISWSGSMFEYLMPSLVMRAPAGSLLEQTSRLIVRRQIEYGEELGIPWGMSDSEYNARDIEQTYQYSSFGVPDLGYKRALAENTVVAPYATALAAMVDPAAAVRNFKRLARLGARGEYGWYEAVDYTRSRVPDGAKFAVVRAYMAHHQAMSLVAIGDALQDGAMRARFHAEAFVQAAELLLQERMPRDVALARQPPEHTTEAVELVGPVPEVRRRYTSAHSRVPRTQLLSNGRYSVMVTAVGSGYSRWRNTAVTRWREDTTGDGWGSYIFLSDVRSGDVWSAGYQPCGAEPDAYDVVFSEDGARIVRRDGSISTVLEIAISPEDDAEVRRVSITNHGARTREIDVTSYAEIALARQSDDLAHPAFSKLFVETEFVSGLGAILATRRRRSDGDPQIWAAHLVVVEGETSGDVQFETDRARFLGRGRTSRAPAAVCDGWPLSDTVGPVLDPVFSLRQRVRIPRGDTARLAFWTMAAPTREAVLDLADKHHDAMAYERATTLAWTQAQMQLHHLGISSDDAHLFQRLANHVLYSDPALRPAQDVLKRGARKSSTLWAQGISGDLPIVLVQVAESDDLELVRQVLRAHEYWRLKQLAVDLVILNERAPSYIQDLQNSLDALVRTNRSMPKGPGDDTRGAVFVLRADLVPSEVRGLVQTAARAVLRGGRGTLAEQINWARDRKPPTAAPIWRVPANTAPEPKLPQPVLEYFNGFGGFGAQGREYATILEEADCTPAPWINVIANPSFGFQVSSEGGGYTWALNSQQNQLTPWSNDPVGDAPGEVLYVRDEETGEVWSATALPIREKVSPYTAIHGLGYSRFEHRAHGVALELLQFVPVDDAIKISRLKLTDHSGRVRRLSVTAYVEWVLGASRTATAPFVVTEIDPKTGAMFAQNPWSNEFGEQVAFADLAGRQATWTGDRTEFIGRDGTLDRPLGLAPGAQLSCRVGAGLDPCGALQTRVTLYALGAVEVILFLGEAPSRGEAQSLITKYRAADLDTVFAAVTKQWDDVTGAIQVKTPDRTLDILMNHWLPYQTLSCRVWARTGFYQASGAYGFRDQLQDVMALCVSRPDLTRAHLLRAAGRQFAEGDVQHWWLPDTGRGIRTRITDDRIWLAYVTAHYVGVTSDLAVLEEMVPFLNGPVLREGQHDAFFQPITSTKQASVFEHCALALDTSLATGAHGLPLMGTGDWNDGMDRVGEGGKGESVWLGWFLHATLMTFARLAERRRDGRAHDWLEHAAALKGALEQHGWDGDWYRRAYFDNGTPLGSVSNSECRIDSIAQSWSVISGAAEPARAERAMAAADKYLVRHDDLLALLLTPPFDHAGPDPGYIKGYPAGIRENGGQYTHAAAWLALAFARLGDGDRAFELLSLLNPINHANNPSSIHRYKVEPYVVSADIYSAPPHVGRGGWTWYSGSAGWIYRVALEGILGFRLQGSNLLIDPCIPKTWPSYEIAFRHGGARYDIRVENPLGISRGVLAIKLDGEMLSRTPPLIPVTDDGASHSVQVILG
ncbi:MAG TPA: glucoamylase family protein [Stellaceae bacterium]|nr:glucoamylase family protein [Stellaceae bacterium]